MGGTLGIAAVMGAGLWYMIQIAPYGELPDQTQVEIAGTPLPIKDFRAIDGDNSPLKFRACFSQDWDLGGFEQTDDANPLVAPGWFECFDAKAITADLDAGNAVGFEAGRNAPFGTTRYIAAYPDGRAFMWRQLNECGEAFFSGDPLPSGCPSPEGEAMEKKPGVISGGIGPVDVKIALTPIIGDTPEPVAIRNPQATSDNSDVDSFYACFDTDLNFAFVTETYEILENVDPPSPASHLPCFDADKIRDDVYSGEAIAVMGERGYSIGVDRLVVLYQDGRGYAWNQRAK